MADPKSLMGMKPSEESSPPHSPPRSEEVDFIHPAFTPPPPPLPGQNDGILGQLAKNPLFTGGLGLVALTASAALARKSFTNLAIFLRQQLLVTLEIPSKDKSYAWFLHWMSEHQRQQSLVAPKAVPERLPPIFTPSGLLARIKPSPRKLAVETKYTQHPNGSLSTDFYLVPGPGKHILNFHGTLLQIERTRHHKMIDMTTGGPWETLSLTTLFRDRHVFRELLTEAQSLALRLQEGKTVIFTSWGTEWKQFGSPRGKRPLSSVVLARGIKDRLVGDITTFLSAKKWYHDRGIPYRRGYLLYGPPGTGKSSFVQALAGELDYSICLLNLSERGLTDDRLNHLLSNLPERSIALLEDVDAAFGNRRVQTAEDGYRGANVTFSGLLNALDGVASSEERIVVLTTNHVERLDEALIRPGRVDVRAEIGYATPGVVEEMWERFYGPGSVPEGQTIEKSEEERREGLKKRFLNEMRERGAFDGMGVSPAGLQGLFVFFKGDPDMAVKEARAVVPGEKRDDGVVSGA